MRRPRPDKLCEVIDSRARMAVHRGRFVILTFTFVVTTERFTVLNQPPRWQNFVLTLLNEPPLWRRFVLIQFNQYPPWRRVISKFILLLPQQQILIKLPPLLLTLPPPGFSCKWRVGTRNQKAKRDSLRPFQRPVFDLQNHLFPPADFQSPQFVV